MKNFLLVFVILIASQPEICFGQNYEVGGLLGPRKTTDILMIGNDAENFYNIRIDREKKYFYGSLESYSIAKMTKNWTAGFSPQQFDSKFISFEGIYLTEAGVVYFYTRNGEVSHSVELVQAKFIPENKGSWESKVLITLENVKDLPEIIITQNKDKGFIIAASEFLQTRMITNKIVKVMQLNGMLNATYSSEVPLPEKSRFWNILEYNKNIFLFISSRTEAAIQKVISINAASKEIRTHDLWDFEKGNKDQTELILKDGFLQEDKNNTIVLCMKITNTKLGTYNSMNGFGFVTFNSAGEVTAKKEVMLPVEIMNKEKVIYNYDLESFEIVNGNYIINTENNISINNFQIHNGKIERFTKFSRITAIHDDVNIYYTKQIMVDVKERTRFLYNKTATSIGGEDEYKKDYWKNVRAVYGEIDDNGKVVEKDLNIVIGGNKYCQIQPTQSIVLDNKDVITVVAKGEDIYMLKLFLHD